MPDLSDLDIADLVTGTLRDFGKPNFGQVASRLVDYEFARKILKNDKIQYDSGVAIRKQIMMDHSNAARHVGLYATDSTNVNDVMAYAEVPWRHTTSNFSYERREMLENKGAEQIYDLIKVRESDAMIAMTELIETAGWNKPVDSTDTTTPFGIPYWIVKNASEGFNGGNPSGFTAGAGGLSSTTYTRWANYTGQYAAISKDDLIRKMRKAWRNIKFKSPVKIPDIDRESDYRIYVNEATMDGLEQVGEAQNENLGKDIAPYEDEIAFRKVQIIRAQKLDSDTTNPVYMIDFGTFSPIILKGDNMRRSEPIMAANQHNVWNVFYDLTWNTLCTNRRKNAVFYV